MSIDARGYQGELAVLVDPDEQGGRGRGILFRAARGTTERDIVIMASRARGICTVTVDEPTAMRLGLHAQGTIPADPDAPYLANSVESRECRETGISAAERAVTMSTIGRADVHADDLTSPGHVMVQVARNVFRPGASLPELAYLLLSARTESRFPGWCDILNDSGDLASSAECRELATEINLPLYTANEAREVGERELADWLRAIAFSKAKFEQ